ncbi:MAG: hypothetical protein DMD96_32530 [Candidatus Rokuibacteriota bacterium]|nr:MAG: hypothetical protein DMD96_32530 [Candidatus Rokubacteria bacterium]
MEIGEWLAVDDRLRRAIIARDARRRAPSASPVAQSSDTPGFPSIPQPGSSRRVGSERRQAAPILE